MEREPSSFRQAVALAQTNLRGSLETLTRAIETANPLRVATWGHTMPQPRQWLVNESLPAGRVALLTGEGGAGEIPAGPAAGRWGGVGGLTFRLGRSAGFVGEYPHVYGFTQGSPPYMWRHLLQSLGVPRFPSAGRCTHIGIADHPPRLQTPAAQLTSGAGIRGNALSPRFGRLDDPKPEIAQTAMRTRIRGVYGDSVGRSDRRFCNLRLAYRSQRDPPSPNTSRRFGATAPRTVLQS